MTDDDARFMATCPHCGASIVELPLPEASLACPACGFPLSMPESLLMTDAEWESLLTSADTLSIVGCSECDPAYDPAPAVPLIDMPT
jgi:hypothetical protein